MKDFLKIGFLCLFLSLPLSRAYAQETCEEPDWSKPVYGVVGDLTSPTYKELRNTAAQGQDLETLRALSTRTGLDLKDVVQLLHYRFLGKPIRAPGNPAVIADINGDGDIDITDAVNMLTYLFFAGPPPGHNFPNLEYFESPDSLTLYTTHEQLKLEFEYLGPRVNANGVVVGDFIIKDQARAGQSSPAVAIPADSSTNCLSKGQMGRISKDSTWIQNAMRMKGSS